MRARAFITQKANEQVSDCQDRFSINAVTGSAAVCDGIREDAKKAGFSRKDLKQARKALGVKTYHDADDESGELVPQWFWYRKEEDQDAGS